MKTPWKEIDLRTWERRATYDGFRACSFPFLVVGVDLELGDSVAFWKENDISPYLACIYVACRAANDTPAFRQRIRDDKLIEYERVHADFTVPSGSESFTIRQVEFDDDFPTFIRHVTARGNDSVVDPGDPTESDHWIFMTCLPWTSFTHVWQPMKSVDDCVPRLAWGRFAEKDGVWKMPISVQAHHAIVDGVHIARLLERMTEYFKRPATTFGSTAR